MSRRAYLTCVDVHSLTSITTSVRINPSKREKALRSFLENARREVDRSRQKEIVGICVSFSIGKIQFNHVGGNGRIKTYQALQSPSLWLTRELDILSPAISHSESLLFPFHIPLSDVYI